MKLPLDEYMAFLDKREIPPYPPEGASTCGWDAILDIDKSMSMTTARTWVTQKKGMWCIVDQVWTKQLAEWIGNRKVLEIMAGAGWLAKALSDHGVNIIATDGFCSHGIKKSMTVFPVEKMRPKKAVQTFEADILLVSWPPYDQDRALISACIEWGTKKPVVFIGESEGGCTASDKFFDIFHRTEDVPEFSMMSWPYIHDWVQVGKLHLRRKRLEADLPQKDGNGIEAVGD